MKRWTTAAAAVAAVFFALSLSGAVYEATSPSYLEWHVMLRKTYSIVAFGIVGLALDRAALEWKRPLSLLATTAAVALFSASIEVGQHVTGSLESWKWNAFDVACGALGGALAWFLDRRLLR